MKKVFLSLITVFMVLSLSVVLVKANETTTVVLEEGVQIRTDGNNGLRWQASVTNPVEGQTYGFLFAQGEIADLTVETANVVNQEVTVLNEDGTFAATMVKFPKAAATQDISVKAYVKVGEEYIYSTNTVVRNLSEVAVAAYKKGLEGDFVKAVYDASETTFNLNGGELIADHEFKVTRFNAGSATGKYIGMSPSSNPSGATGKFWYRICLKYVEELDLYKVVAVRTSGADLGTIDYDYIIGAFESSATCTDKDAHKVIKNLVASGDAALDYYAQFDVPTTSSCDVKVRLFKDYSLFNNKNHYGGGATLPEVYKEHYDFAGWYNNAELNGESVKVQGKDRTLYAKFSPTKYTITYNLNGGTTSKQLVSEYNIESESIVLPTASEMNIEGGKFGGWFTNSAMSGEAVTEIAAGSNGNIQLYAYWIMDAPTVIELTSADSQVLAQVNPTIIVNPLVKAGNYIVDGVEYSTGSSAFATVANALTVAKENDVIYVFGGTYSDALNISVANLTIIGPNYNILGKAERNTEANITALTTISATNVTLNGLKFTSNGNIKVGANNTLITYIYMAPSKTVPCNGQNRQGCIVDSANISNLTVSNSYINAPNNGYSYNSYVNQFMSFNNVSNLTIDNNYITNNGCTTTDGSGNFAGMRIYTLGGTFKFTNNELRWATNGYSIFLNNVSAATQIDFIDNIFDGNGNVNHTATLTIRSGSTKTVTNIIGNEFYNFKGSTFSSNNDNGSQFNIKYNYFDQNTNFKLGTIGSAKFAYTNNYYEASQTTTTSDYGVITSKDALDAAYAEYLATLE